MLTISSKSHYGLLALLELTEFFNKELVQISDIVRRRNVPKSYLEQIFNRLTKIGIVKSVRGNKGGYELGRHPDSISLLEIIEALEGKLELCNNSHSAALTEVLKNVENKLTELLRISLSTLLERQRILEQQIMFTI